MTTTTSIPADSQVVIDQSAGEVNTAPTAGTLIKAIAIVVPLISFAIRNGFLIAGMTLAGKAHPMEIAVLVGGMIGVYLMPLIVMLLFQIGKRFRNPRSRWLISLYTGLFYLAVNIISALLRPFSILGTTQ